MWIFRAGYIYEKKVIIDDYLEYMDPLKHTRTMDLVI